MPIFVNFSSLFCSFLKRKSRTSVLLLFFGEANYCKVEYRNFTKGEYLLALRLANKLADLRAANANPYSKHKCFECVRCGYGTKIKT